MERLNMSNKPVLHVIGLAHLPTAAIDPVHACAYSGKIRRTCEMMTNHGFDVIFYGVEGSKVIAKESVVVLSEADRMKNYGPLEEFSSKFFQHGKNDPAYVTFKANATREILERVQPGDIFCNPMGNYYEEMCKSESQGGIEKANGYPFLVESGIGYSGILLNTHRVFESHPWQNYVYGIYNAWTQGQSFGNGEWYDDVIPNFYDPGHYKFNASKEDYFFMNCRIAQRKGIDIAIQTMEAMGGHLILAGQPGEDVKLDSPNVEYIGYISEKEKIDLLAHAKGLFSTTKYIGPFEGIAVEAQLSGCPVITTDFGCYTETVQQGLTGYRGMVLRDFVDAAKNIEKIKPKTCRNWAVSQFSMDACAPRYANFFRRLGDLWSEGWNKLD
jgi:glycosyltransferase involved in cell wall biosynthesis